MLLIGYIFNKKNFHLRPMMQIPMEQEGPLEHQAVGDLYGAMECFLLVLEQNQDQYGKLQIKLHQLVAVRISYRNFVACKDTLLYMINKSHTLT